MGDRGLLFWTAFTVMAVSRHVVASGQAWFYDTHQCFGKEKLGRVGDWFLEQSYENNTCINFADKDEMSVWIDGEKGAYAKGDQGPWACWYFYDAADCQEGTKGHQTWALELRNYCMDLPWYPLTALQGDGWGSMSMHLASHFAYCVFLVPLGADTADKANVLGKGSPTLIDRVPYPTAVAYSTEKLAVSPMAESRARCEGDWTSSKYNYNSDSCHEGALPGTHTWVHGQSAEISGVKEYGCVKTFDAGGCVENGDSASEKSWRFPKKDYCMDVLPDMLSGSWYYSSTDCPDAPQPSCLLPHHNSLVVGYDASCV